MKTKMNDFFVEEEFSDLTADNDHLPPQLYHREDARSNSLPPEVLHSSVYQPPLRERFNSLDSNYCSGAEHRAGLHRVCGNISASLCGLDFKQK